MFRDVCHISGLPSLTLVVGSSYFFSVGVSRTFASEQETLICDVLTTLW